MRAPEEPEHGATVWHVPTSVVTPSEQSLCSFHGQRRAKEAQIACFLARRYIESSLNNKKMFLSSIKPRFQLLHVRIGLFAGSDVEHHVVSVLSVDQSKKTSEILTVSFFHQLLDFPNMFFLAQLNTPDHVLNDKKFDGQPERRTFQPSNSIA